MADARPETTGRKPQELSSGERLLPPSDAANLLRLSNRLKRHLTDRRRAGRRQRFWRLPGIRRQQLETQPHRYTYRPR